MFNLALAREQAGISLANGHLSIVLAAYLYVSGKHIRKVFEGNWKEMDEVVHTHIDAMFFGKLPDTPHKMHATWILRLGGIPWSRGSRTNFRINLAFRGGDRTGKLPAKKSQASCLSTSDTANFLCQWHEGKETMIKTIHSIHRVMQTMETKCVRIHSEFELITDFVNRSDKVSKHAKLQPLNFLPALVEHVSADCQRFNIDYITLTRTCNGLLGALVDRNMLKSEIELVKAFPDHYEHHPFCQFFGDMKTIMSNPVHVVDGLIMSDRVWHDTSDSDEFRRILRVDKKRGKKQNESWTDPSPMFVVADFVQKYLDERKMLVHSGEDVVDQQDLRDRVYFSQFLGRFMEKLGSGSVREVFDEMPPPEGLWGLNSLASEAKQGTSTGEVKVPTGKKTQVRLEEVVDEDFVGD